MLALELLVGLLDLLQSLRLFAQQSVLLLGDLQADSKLGVFIRECGEIFVRREH